MPIRFNTLPGHNRVVPEDCWLSTIPDIHCSANSKTAIVLLANRAMQKKPLCHNELAQKLGIASGNELAIILEEIGMVLDRIGAACSEKIPCLQLLVLDSATGLPRCGTEKVLPPDCPLESLGTQHRSAIVEALHRYIFGYPYWKDLLVLLDITNTANACSTNNIKKEVTT
ncbi:MAG: hypothetical protein FJY09_00210 [Chlorobi bacterium]|nr:hypothetical protein [Chlorobiota bacterium]